jgi:hypothetical protein
MSYEINTMVMQEQFPPDRKYKYRMFFQPQSYYIELQVVVDKKFLALKVGYLVNQNSPNMEK